MNSNSNTCADNDNVDDIAYMLYSSPPKEPCSIVLQIDSPEGQDVVGDLLLHLVLYGAKFLYGLESPGDLQKWQIDKIKEYIASIGYQTLVTCNGTDICPFTMDKKDIVSIEIKFKPFPVIRPNISC